MAIFEVAFENTFQNEKGYTADPHPTICGIDRKWHPEFVGWKQVDAKIAAGGDPDDLLKDELFMSDVRRFYRSNFWPPIYNLITNQRAANIIFDRGVNMGIHPAVQIAQRLLGIPDDGSFGKDTLFHVNQAGEGFSAAYDAACDEYYKQLAAEHPEDRKYLKGWLNRR